MKMNNTSFNLAAQSTYFKLQRSTSKDSGIFLDNTVYEMLVPYFSGKDEKGNDTIDLLIFKEDCIKALANIMCSLPLFSSVAGVPKEENNAVEIYLALSKQISDFFGENDTAILSSLYFTDLQGRKYLWGTEGKRRPFELRKFFVANHTELYFDTEKGSRVVLRFKTHIVSENKEEFEPLKVEAAPSIVDEPLQLIYFGAPGTGKSYAIDGKTDDSNSFRTTFHPDSDYASFVGAYKPTMENVPINSIYGESVQYATGKNGHPGTEKKIVYKYVPQAFLKAYVAAWSDLDNPHFLVIEEINRGNCAQIFGDLFQLLDRNSQGASSYAIHSDEDIAQFLAGDEKGFAKLNQEQKDVIGNFVLVKDNGKTEDIGQAILSGEKLLLPPNLYIWATMNTSDQSLFPIDSAFKRRWNWRYVPIQFFDDSTDLSLRNRSFEVGSTRYSWSSFLRIMNPIITDLTESADKQMGFFFGKPDKKSNSVLKNNDVISEDIFVNKVLFYLWTDVLKDYNIGREEFKNPDKPGKALEFADFFVDGKNYLNQFITKLGVAKIDDIETDDNSESDYDDDSFEEDTSKPRLAVKVGDKSTTLRRAFLEITQQAIAKTSPTFDELYNTAKEASFSQSQLNRLFLKEEDRLKWLEVHKADSKAMQRYLFDSPLISKDNVTFYVTGQGWVNDQDILNVLAKYAKSLNITYAVEG